MMIVWIEDLSHLNQETAGTIQQNSAQYQCCLTLREFRDFFQKGDKNPPKITGFIIDIRLKDDVDLGLFHQALGDKKSENGNEIGLLFYQYILRNQQFLKKENFTPTASELSQDQQGHLFTAYKNTPVLLLSTNPTADFHKLPESKEVEKDTKCLFLSKVDDDSSKVQEKLKNWLENVL